MDTANVKSVAPLTNGNSGANGVKPLTTTVSMSRRIGLPNYGNADVFLSLTGITVETTESEIDAALDATKIVYHKIAERIKAKINEIKAGEVLG